MKHTATVQKKTTEKLKKKIDNRIQSSGVDIEEEMSIACCAGSDNSNSKCL